MSKPVVPRKILIVEAVGFAIVILMIWLNEFFDLPHKVLKAPATPINTIESLFETAIVLVLAIAVVLITNRMIRRLHDANAEKARLFDVIAHDLRAPFTSLIGNTELLRKNFSELSEEERRSLSSGIFQAADKSQGLLENLLLWAQLKVDTTPPAPEGLDLYELVESCLSQQRKLVGAKNISLINSAPRQTYVLAESDAVRSVLRNLVSNAVKYSRPGATVEVQAKARGGKVRVSVLDSGVGMTKGDMKKVFQMATRLSKAGTAGETGSGLGLILVRELVQRSGGKVRLRSEVDKGTNVTFTLPKTRIKGQAAKAKAKAKPSSAVEEPAPEQD